MNQEIVKITLGFGGLYANLFLANGEKIQVTAKWFESHWPEEGDVYTKNELGLEGLIKSWELDDKKPALSSDSAGQL